MGRHCRLLVRNSWGVDDVGLTGRISLDVADRTGNRISGNFMS